MILIEPLESWVYINITNNKTTYEVEDKKFFVEMAYKVLFKDNAKNISLFESNYKTYWRSRSVRYTINECNRENRNDVMDVLTEYRCNVNLQNRVAWIALHYCCEHQPNNLGIL